MLFLLFLQVLLIKRWPTPLHAKYKGSYIPSLNLKVKICDYQQMRKIFLSMTEIPFSFINTCTVQKETFKSDNGELLKCTLIKTQENLSFLTWEITNRILFAMTITISTYAQLLVMLAFLNIPQRLVSVQRIL